ncbi:SIMPL domain-containing protein [Lysobacter enzymogenes]|uniref:SIMPL domain-containing protein n=1 Tax=Lysobacter enzymogenes TaxID=69 RepID=UPI0037480B46
MNTAAAWILALGLAMPAAAAAQDIETGGRLRVAGFGRVAWQPDQYELAFAAVGDGVDANAARERFEPAQAALRRALDAEAGALAGRAQDPPRLQSRGTQAAPQWRFSSRFAVRVRGEAAVVRLQQALAEAGVAEFELRPFSERLAEYTEQAQRLALRDAQRRARATAQELGWRLRGARTVKFLDERPWWSPQAPTARQYGARAYDYAAEAPAQTGEVTAQAEVEFEYSR